MAIVGYNVYLDGTKINTTPVPMPYTAEGLDSATPYGVTVTAVDGAGNESDPSDEYTFSTDVFSSEDPMLEADTEVIDQIVTEAMIYNQLGVAVSITGPKGFYHKAYGSAGSRPLTPDDHMRIGSITKLFVSLLIMMRYEAGLLSLDDTIGTYVENIPNGDVITLKNLLMMRSGLQDFSTTASAQQTMGLNPAAAWTRDQSLNLIRSSPTVFAPDAQYQYNNSNFVLLGMVLERISGETRTVRQIIADDVLGPLGLAQTSFPTTSAMPEPYSIGRGANPLHAVFASFGLGFLFPPIRNETVSNPDFPHTAGGMVATVGDLNKFAQHLCSDTLLLPETRQMWETTNFTTGFPATWTIGPPSYDYGMGLLRTGSWYGHDGSWFGYSTATMYLPGNGCVISVMENYQTPNIIAWSRIFGLIAEHLFPGSTTQPDYATGGPFEGGMGVTLGAPAVSLTGGIPGAADLPLTFPAAFELV